MLVYEQLRSTIVSGELTQDSQIVQERVAEELGVSRTPVREALNRLSHEGLVGWIAGVGYVVNSLDDHDIAEIEQVRSALEPLAVKLALGNYTADHLSRASALIDQMADADPTDVDAHFELNRSFHLAMTEPCGNSLLTTMLDELWNQPINRRITGAYVRGVGNVERMITEHRRIVAAAADNDPTSLLALVADHLLSGYASTMHAT
jgi:DNA-binding GntR family transcriptional regulator